MRFSLHLNTTHYYEVDPESLIPTKKYVGPENVKKEALPMKQCIVSSTPFISDTTKVASPVVSAAVTTIVGQKLDPVVDTSKGYIRLPELPLFHDTLKSSSLPGGAAKNAEHDSSAPKMPEALLHPPPILTETPTTLIPGVTTPYSPDPEKEELDYDVDEMLEASEAIKKDMPSKKSSTTEPASAAPNFPLALTTELFKLVDNISTITQNERKISPENESHLKSPQATEKTGQSNHIAGVHVTAKSPSMVQPPLTPSSLSPLVESNSSKGTLNINERVSGVQPVNSSIGSDLSFLSKPSTTTVSSLCPIGSSTPTLMTSAESVYSSVQSSSVTNASQVKQGSLSTECSSQSKFQMQNDMLSTPQPVSKPVRPLVEQQPLSPLKDIKMGENVRDPTVTSKITAVTPLLSANANLKAKHGIDGPLAKKPKTVHLQQPKLTSSDLKKLSNLSTSKLPTSLLNVSKHTTANKACRVSTSVESSKAQAVGSPVSKALSENNAPEALGAKPKLGHRAVGDSRNFSASMSDKLLTVQSSLSLCKSEASTSSEEPKSTSPHCSNNQTNLQKTSESHDVPSTLSKNLVGLSSASDTIKALNSIASKSHLPSKLLITKDKTVAMSPVKSLPVTSGNKPSHCDAKEISKEHIKHKALTTKAHCDSSMQVTGIATACDVPIPDFKGLLEFKGKKLPKSLLISHSSPSSSTTAAPDKNERSTAGTLSEHSFPSIGSSISNSRQDK